LDQLQPLEIDLLDDVGAAQRQQIADVPRGPPRGA
jgi:hypothetical protein